MKSNAVAVIGYPDKLNKHRLSTNRNYLCNLINHQAKTKQKQ